MMNRRIPRRAFFGKAAAGAALALGGFPSLARGATRARQGARPARAVRLGVASYSLRKFAREPAIEMIRALRTPYVNVKSVHLPYDLSAAALAAGRREFEAAGLEIVGGGTIYFEKDTDEAVGRFFEYAKLAGMPVIVAAGPPAVLPRVERYAKRYDIRVAIHNHGPEDEFYPSPYDALKYIGNMDPRMGLCIDIGHTARTGVDIVQSIADAGSRLFDMHVKDLRDLSDKDSQCVVGEGAMPIADIFDQLHAMDYQGYANLEYEIEPEDPLPGMQRSFAHMRGVIAGLGLPHPGAMERP